MLEENKDVDIEGEPQDSTNVGADVSQQNGDQDEDTFWALEEPDDDENDMLDMAFGLTDTSRLGCQVGTCFLVSPRDL